VPKRKTRTISIRVSEQEYAELCGAGETAGAPSLSEYMRSTLFGRHPARDPESGAVFDQRLGHLASHVEDLNSRFEKLCVFVGLPEAR
jgi:hypothetical protein